MKRVDHLASVDLVVRAMSGTDIDTALRETVTLAFTEGRKATLIFNDREFEVVPANIMSSIYARAGAPSGAPPKENET